MRSQPTFVSNLAGGHDRQSALPRGERYGITCKIDSPRASCSCSDRPIVCNMTAVLLKEDKPSEKRLKRDAMIGAWNMSRAPSQSGMVSEVNLGILKFLLELRNFVLCLIRRRPLHCQTRSVLYHIMRASQQDSHAEHQAKVSNAT